MLRQDLHNVGAPVVVILSDRAEPNTAAVVRRARPKAGIHHVPADLDDGEVHLAVATVGPCDMLIDESGAENRYARIRNNLFHLRPGGVLLVRAPSKRLRLEGGAALDRERAAMAELLSIIGAGWVDFHRVPRPEPRDDAERFGQAVKAFELCNGHLVLVNRVRAQAKIRDEQITALLTRRPDIGRVVARRPGESWEVSHLATSDPYHATPIPTRWTAPELTCREYHEVLSAPGQIVTRGSLILPETFRHINRARLGNRYLKEVAHGFGDATEPAWFVQEPPADGPRRLKGSYFYLDSEFRGHFGHMTTEVISRLWAWPEAKAADPDLKALLHFNKARHFAGWEKQLLMAAGIAEEDLTFTYDPVQVERLVSATPMFVNPSFVHPGIRDTWHRIGANLADQSSVEVPQRLFIGRQIKKRPCRNAAEVEQFFEDQGFRVVYPEDYNLSDQVRMFRETSVIAGFAGSGMFNMMFACEPKPVIVISSESYSGRNEALIAGVNQHPLHVAWCRSEASWNGNRFVRPKGIPMHAGFTFDFANEGAFVRELISALPVPA